MAPGAGLRAVAPVMLLARATPRARPGFRPALVSPLPVLGPAFWAAGALLACAVPAAAQQPRQPQQPQVQAPVPGTRYEPPPGAVVNNPYRVFGDEGPDFAPLSIVGALGIRPTASMIFQYDSNLARQPDGAPLPGRFKSKSDLIFRPSVGLTAERNVGRHRVFGSVGIGRAIHARNSQLDSNRFNVGGGIGFVLGNSCGGQLDAGYSKRDLLIGGFDEAADATAESTTFGGSLNCSTISGISAGVAYNQGTRTNRSDEPTIDRSFADANFRSASGTLGYRVGQRGQVGVSAAWSENRFPNQLVLGQENQVEVKSLSLFGTYRIGSVLNVNGSIGQTRVSSATPGSQDFSGNIWNIGIGYAGPRIGANISTARSVNGGGQQAANLSVSQSFNASATYRLNDSMGLSAGYSRADQDFISTALVPESNVSNSFVNDRIFIGADYRMARLLSFSLDLNHQRRTSDPDTFNFKSTSIIFGVNARF
jgi:hypothetical protein